MRPRPRQHDDDWFWPPTYSVGSYSGLDDRHKKRGKKHPLGFAPPVPKPKPEPRKRKR